MRLIIRDDPEAASLYVANYIVDRINFFNPTPSQPFVLGLPTGSSPVGVYKILVKKYKAGEVSFKNVVTFNMDEYIGIPRDHEQSYHTFMWQNFFSHVDVLPSNVHILNGNAPDLEAECEAYEAAIEAAGGIDLFLAGIGEDGHIAFNEPGSSLASRTRVKTLARDTIVANSRFFGDNLNLVPKTALTVGVQTVLEAREVVAIVLGTRKALALQRCVEEPINHMWTLSSLQMHCHAMIVCDEDATGELRVKTAKYFKSIEKVAQDAGFGPQVLPAKLRTRSHNAGHHHKLPTPPETVVHEPESPTIIQPQPTAPSKFMLHAAPTLESASRSASPVFDSMASRIDDPAIRREKTPEPVFDRMALRVGEPGLAGRLTPQPQSAAVGA